MQVTATDVKKLREATGAGMMECKRALVECEGDFNKSVIHLREKGLAAAKKKAGRIASDGKIAIKIAEDYSRATVLEINTETDFVAKNDEFLTLVETVLDETFATSHQDLGAFMESPLQSNNEKTGLMLFNEAIAKIGENIQFRRFITWTASENEFICDYTHGDGKIGVLVHFDTGNRNLKKNNEYAALARDICMHIAAAKPGYLESAEVATEVLDQEKAIFRKQLLDQGKPENILDKIIEGKMAKFYKENCLINQDFVKDDKMSIADVLKTASKKFETTIGIKMFVRFELGEGIEKKEQNLAEEIASLTK